MRKLSVIKQIFTDLAMRDDRIRAILLQGSRANSKIVPDAYQDYDIFLVVNQMEEFIGDHRWTSVFGERIIWQLPDEMKTVDDQHTEKDSFHYLMLFKDNNRIDLTLFPKEKINRDFKPDSLSVLWMDKDGLFDGISKADDSDYLIKKPSENEFAECCNEFRWVSTYISKGLKRKEITYAKAMMEGTVRRMFMRMIEWYIGTETGFSVSFGQSGKMMKRYLDKQAYKKILTTYPDYKIKNIRDSLFIMMEIFNKYATHVAEKLKFKYDHDEHKNVFEFLRKDDD
ncbi:MAG TPA: aminoglycoside 6-adenylyltransferase [Puia sp.]|nr:aminoglycoside 6-adenylyltransferase [Puia sp.]